MYAARQCIKAFNNICLDRDILELHVCINARCADFNFLMESSTKAAYNQFGLWNYGKLGIGNRPVIPACAVRSFAKCTQPRGLLKNS